MALKIVSSPVCGSVVSVCMMHLSARNLAERAQATLIRVKRPERGGDLRGAAPATRRPRRFGCRRWAGFATLGRGGPALCRAARGGGRSACARRRSRAEAVIFVGEILHTIRRGGRPGRVATRPPRTAKVAARK